MDKYVKVNTCNIIGLCKMGMDDIASESDRTIKLKMLWWWRGFVVVDCYLLLHT
jgi:hypothetical protein